ncbi:MAG: Ig-like domain-containing protein [Gemmatirosa sp.]|nr:Ig-like domain-containing protein [Gemmatirosa sp.]
MSSFPARPHVVRAAARAGMLVALAACRDTAGPPMVRAVRIVPRVTTAISVGGSYRLQAAVDADGGADTTVRWTSVPSLAGQVTEDGLVTTCYPGGRVVVTATSVADPTKFAVDTVLVLQPAVGWASVGGPIRTGTGPALPGDGVPRDSVTGDVDLYVSLGAGGFLACRGIERLDLRVQRPGLDSLIARLDFTPPFSDSRTFRVPLHAGALPNGTYAVSGAAYVSGVPSTVPLLGFSMTVRNP